MDLEEIGVRHNYCLRLKKPLEEALYRIALRRWENKDDPIITTEEIHKRLGI